MEDIQLLLILALIAFSIFRFISKEKKENTLPPVIEEEFDGIDMSEDETPFYQQVSNKTAIPTAQPTYRNRKSVDAAKQPNVSLQPEKRTKNSKATSIDLSSRAEAKRAFIYSEIFKRKY